MGFIPDMDTTCGSVLEGILGWCLNVHEWLLKINLDRLFCHQCVNVKIKRSLTCNIQYKCSEWTKMTRNVPF